MIFESHAHYDDKAFDDDREKLLNQLPNEGIEYVVNIGSSIEATKETIELIQRYSYIYGAVGVHPSETASLDEESFTWLSSVTNLKKVVAIGEIGLDYYWDTPDRRIQKKWFERQMDLAKQVNLPVVIHSRDAAKDTFDMIKDSHLDKVGGTIHCFSYSKEVAKKYLDLGFYLGIGGVITFKNGKKLKEVVQYAPIENILIETDSPYLSPEPNRGKRNSSINLKYIASEIAKIKGMEYDEVVEITRKNGLKLFNRIK